MIVALPDADIPLTQLSLRSDLNPADHIRAGRALAPLRAQGVLIVGSGMSFPNLGERGPHVTARSADWDAALPDAVTDPDPERRAARIAPWDRLPFAPLPHPRETNLLSLILVLGAAARKPRVR